MPNTAQDTDGYVYCERLEAHDTLMLNDADSRAFVDALLDPPPVNTRLQDSVRRYREITGI